ncbi:hypothetical protein F5148DRAFT_1368776 [Russula earlei]|uniref:Uncharacterized protein n=1 Tax=Russula earlei TaxID=71964 RepID=A0ACC0U6V5_9AGAM|nr:hypothetical protein F5148DRAFT_1368776 [Russula earlei]
MPDSPQFNAKKTKMFDHKQFLNLVNDKGRAYRHQAKELISICRSLYAASEQCFRQDNKLSRALEECDKAIGLAVNSRLRTQAITDLGFRNAIRKLHDYETEYHPSRGESVKTSMNQAKDKDETNKKRKFLTQGEPFIVEFRILPTLPHTDPVIVRQALFSTSDVPEILWNFSHLDDGRRLALAEKPHFYEELPENLNAYVGTFHRRPKLECFRDRDSLFVLKSEERRVFFECSIPQAFDNVWVISNNMPASRGILIFRHIYGDLFGEAKVGDDFDFPPTLLCSRVVPDGGPEQFRLEAVDQTDDWRAIIAMIHKLLDANHTRIHFKPLTL